MATRIDVEYISGPLPDYGVRWEPRHRQTTSHRKLGAVGERGSVTVTTIYTDRSDAFAFLHQLDLLRTSDDPRAYLQDHPERGEGLRIYVLLHKYQGRPRRVWSARLGQYAWRLDLTLDVTRLDGGLE